MTRKPRRRSKHLIEDLKWVRMFRDDAAAEQGQLCIYCFEPMTAATRSGDHVNPRAKGGFTKRENIKAACSACNLAKGEMTKNQFLALIKVPTYERTLRLLKAYIRRRIWLQVQRTGRRIERMTT